MWSHMQHRQVGTCLWHSFANIYKRPRSSVMATLVRHYRMFMYPRSHLSKQCNPCGKFLRLFYQYSRSSHQGKNLDTQWSQRQEAARNNFQNIRYSHRMYLQNKRHTRVLITHRQEEQYLSNTHQRRTDRALEKLQQRHMTCCILCNYLDRDRNIQCNPDLNASRCLFHHRNVQDTCSCRFEKLQSVATSSNRYRRYHSRCCQSQCSSSIRQNS